jgi:DNA-binding XRE family transcriptional regulator
LELAFRIAEVFGTKLEDIFSYEIIEEKNKKSDNQID